ncbi:unnamed protein product [Prunus armeniaca]|uniref:Uncharacterized protein n=1 Tax=Prunus armeniaca TaxID=36596 RepID=A0A6J5VAM5_PRUAR|nr:unnamed protein product [Prunus armeniaca]
MTEPAQGTPNTSIPGNDVHSLTRKSKVQRPGWGTKPCCYPVEGNHERIARNEKGAEHCLP